MRTLLLIFACKEPTYAEEYESTKVQFKWPEPKFNLSSRSRISNRSLISVVSHKNNLNDYYCKDNLLYDKYNSSLLQGDY